MNTKKLWTWICASFMAFTISCAPSFAQDECTNPKGIRIVYLNGVFTSKIKAKAIAEKTLRSRYGDVTTSGAQITYETFYNTTDGIFDLVETFGQRLSEQDQILKTRFEFFFEVLSGSSSLSASIAPVIPAFDAVLKTFIADALVTAAAAALNDLNSSPSIALLSASRWGTSSGNRQRLAEILAAGDGVLLFAHSQGNLFAREAFDDAKKLNIDANVRVVHVAPASPQTRGSHTLVDQDIVINKLRLIGTVPPITNYIAQFKSRPPPEDFTGHGLTEIYLNHAIPNVQVLSGGDIRSPANRITDHVRGALIDIENGLSKCDYMKLSSVTCTVNQAGNVANWVLRGTARSNKKVLVYNGVGPGWAPIPPTSVCTSWSGTVQLYGYQFCSRNDGDPLATSFEAIYASPYAPGYNPSAANGQDGYGLIAVLSDVLKLPNRIDVVRILDQRQLYFKCPGAYSFDPPLTSH